MKNAIQMLFAATLLLSACNNKPAPSTVTEAAKLALPTTKCYEQRFKTDLTAIELTLTGGEASGFYAYEPTEKDGGHGSFKGTVVGDGQIQVVYTYMMEGSVQSEEMVFKIVGNNLLKGAGELVDLKNDGNLTLKDKTKLSFSETFTATDCSKIAESITISKEIAASLVAPVLSPKDSVAAALIAGVWKSSDDPKAGIELTNGKCWFLYDNKRLEPELGYQYHPICPKDCNPKEQAPCLKITGQDYVCYTIVFSDAKTLHISQIDGTGNTNRYTKKK